LILRKAKIFKMISKGKFKFILKKFDKWTKKHCKKIIKWVQIARQI